MENITHTEKGEAFAISVNGIEKRHLSYFDMKRDNVSNHIYYALENNVYFMIWEADSDLPECIRKEVSKAFQRIHKGYIYLPNLKLELGKVV